MLRSIKASLAGSLVACALGCGSEPTPVRRSNATTSVVPATAAQPAAPEYPEPPPLTGDPSECVLRRYASHRNAWEVEKYRYDPEQRTLQGDWMYFDAQGRMAKRVDSDTARIHTYDARGNLQEEASWADDKLVEGTRWDNRYEGKPPRLVATDISDFRKPKQRNQPRIRVSYAYDAAGRIESTTKKRGRISELHLFTWNGERIASVEGTLGAVHSSSKVPYHVRRTYEYDAQGRITRFTVDGMLPVGEGATADGQPDHVSTFSYDASGRLERMESDGWGGDVAPEDPDGKPDQITLLTPPCDPLVKLAPSLFGFPELHLPYSIAPPLR